MQVRHGDDDERVAVLSANQTLRESGYAATMQTGFDFRAGHRESRIIQFLLSDGKETYFHGWRCFAMTVS